MSGRGYFSLMCHAARTSWKAEGIIRCWLALSVERRQGKRRQANLGRYIAEEQKQHDDEPCPVLAMYAVHQHWVIIF